MFLNILGNFSKYFLLHNFSIIRIIPNINPHIIKFQFAPCQIPVNVHTINIFRINFFVPSLLPPNGMYDLPDEVAAYIAKRLKSNVRELEGALQQVVAYQQFQATSSREITIDIAKRVLREQFQVVNSLITIENIQKTVADYYKIKVADMHSKRRPANIARPRQIAMYLTKELTQHSLPEIGENFGGRDHTTVMHAVRKITQERQNDAELNHEIHVLEQMIRG